MERDLLDQSDDALYKQLLLQAGKGGDTDFDSINSKPVGGVSVIPVPGFCIKTKTENNEKVFINVCQAENVPEPRDISEEELVKLLESTDPSGFRVPMSLGEAHAELDKSGGGCTVYDVVVNPKYLNKVKEKELFLGFLLTVVFEGLEHKYNMTLNRDWKMMKNRKSIGTLQPQNIRTQSKPWIQEMGGPSQPMVSEIETKEPPKPKGAEPPYTIVQEPPTGHPEFLVAEIHLPKVKVAATMTLDIGEDRILLQTRSGVYHLDICLPFKLLQEDCGAQFNRKNKILTLTMPVQPTISV